MRYFQCALLFLSIRCCFTVTSQDYSDEEIDPHRHSYCICVPYWQCKEDFSGFIEDGVDIMDVR